MRGTMKVNGLTCDLHMPKALKSQRLADGTEVALGLPPANLQPAYPVDEYPACPDNWEHGSDKASSYFVGIKAGEGMWLDFNGCRAHTHDVAILVSVQGINSVTGQATLEGRFHLEQYRERCPKHDVPFQQERFCPECKYKWPAQNYVASTGTPFGQLWLDGFRAADGIVRQYLFSEEEARGVAYNKLDKDKPQEEHKRVFAIGIAYFLSKEAKPKPQPMQFLRGVSKGIGGQSVTSLSSMTKTCSYGALEGTAAMGFDGDDLKSAVSYNAPMAAAASADYLAPQAALPTASVDSLEYRTRGNLKGMLQSKFALRSMVPTQERRVEQVTPVKNYEVAAGARINQEVHPDPKDLSYWSDQPAGMIYVNYTDLETLAKILAAGKRAETVDGFLAGDPVGND